MQFVHLADTHLGYRQYGLTERENDFFEVFDQTIDEIIREKPDFVIHSGDLFEYSRPPTRALLTAQKGILRLKEANIPIYAIAGNHDVVMRKNALPPQILYKDFGMKLISPKKPFYIEGDVFIGGAPYASKYHAKHLVEQLQSIEKSSMDYEKRILILHQGIDRYLPYEYEIKIGDVPQSFNYCAFGHIHERVVDDFGEGKLAYPGSTEIWRSNEVEGYKKNGKGFYLVDISGDVPEIENINLKLSREFIKERILYSELQEELTRIKEYTSSLQRKPVMMVTVEGGNFNRSEVYETLNQSLSDSCLVVRSNYQPTATKDERNPFEKGKEMLNIKKMVEYNLKEFNNAKVTELGTELLKELSEGDFKAAETIAHNFYEDLYDN
ncbi:MAG: repair protein SbcD/Mre11 [Methanobacterium sp.]|jgi:exonuclease SbcD|uniref:metallophosphoesterase family protein n=1 Tax=Methanobacterium sp. TaxID=2164 RepID=UPI0003C994C3|nr:DNA repair exonuclease [Methanobacterium sp.]MDI3550207.1 repair protein SbcD/Mre11 [Methanobacterium sp.]CDG64408.1 metallophosphoesterase [Methanobacterium sp. MB1]